MNVNNSSDKITKVIILITKSNWGGAQRYVYDIATNLNKDQFEVVVALGGQGPLVTNLQKANIRVIQIPTLQRDISLFKEILAFRDISKLLKKERPHVFHVNSSKAGVFGALLGRLHRIPNVLYTAHGWSFNEDRPWWQKPILATLHWLTVIMSHKTIAVTHTLIDQLNWLGVRKKSMVIHNGRSIPNFYSRYEARNRILKLTGPDTDKELMNKLWIVTIAELHPVKQHRVALEAIAKLKTENHDIKYFMIGEGELYTELKKMINELKLTNMVYMLGHIHEASKYLPAFDIFLLTSRSEALPYTLVEAGLSEVVSVASNVGGIPEIITDGLSGRLVPANNAEITAEVLKELIEKPEYRKKLAKEAKRHCTKNFSIKSMIKNTTSIYKNP